MPQHLLYTIGYVARAVCINCYKCSHEGEHMYIIYNFIYVVACMSDDSITKWLATPLLMWFYQKVYGYIAIKYL